MSDFDDDDLSEWADELEPDPQDPIRATKELMEKRGNWENDELGYGGYRDVYN